MNFRTTSTRSGNTVIVRPVITKRSGHPLSKVHKVVCEVCNRGWMRDIEDAARDHLIELLDGRSPALDAAAQTSIRNWIALKTFIGETDDPFSQALTPEDAKAFYNDRTLSPTWRIWIGRYRGGNWEFGYRHYGALVAHKAIAPMLQSKVSRNVQSSTFVAGQLLMHSLSTATPLAAYEFSGLAAENLRQIYPPLSDTIDWGATAAIPDEGAEFIADALAHFISRPSLTTG